MINGTNKVIIYQFPGKRRTSAVGACQTGTFDKNFRGNNLDPEECSFAASIGRLSPDSPEVFGSHIAESIQVERAQREARIMDYGKYAYLRVEDL